MMLAGSLAADHHWTERVSFMPYSTLEFLKRAFSEWFPDFLWIDGTESVGLPLLDIFAPAFSLLHAQSTALYWLGDQAVKDKGYFSYLNQYVFFARPEAALAGQGGQVALGHHGLLSLPGAYRSPHLDQLCHWSPSCASVLEPLRFLSLPVGIHCSASCSLHSSSGGDVSVFFTSIYTAHGDES